MTTMDESWRVFVDRDRCVGTGICAGTADDRFIIDDGRSRPLAERIAPDERVSGAADLCPAEAILVRDAGGNVIAPER